MKRVLFSIGGTVVGLVALLDFKIARHGRDRRGCRCRTLRRRRPRPRHRQSAPTGPAGSKAPTGSSAPRTSSSAPSGSTAARTVAGDAVQTHYGIVQVAVALTGTPDHNVSFLQLTAFDGRSQLINSQAAPILVQETLATQSAQIDTVSGASLHERRLRPVAAERARPGRIEMTSSIAAPRPSSTAWARCSRSTSASPASIRRPSSGSVDWLHQVDATFSTYRPESAISRLGRGEIARARLLGRGP